MVIYIIATLIVVGVAYFVEKNKIFEGEPHSFGYRLVFDYIFGLIIALVFAMLINGAIREYVLPETIITVSTEVLEPLDGKPDKYVRIDGDNILYNTEEGEQVALFSDNTIVSSDTDGDTPQAKYIITKTVSPNKWIAWTPTFPEDYTRTFILPKDSVDY